MIEQITSAALRGAILLEISVLAPMYKGQAGIDNINTLMQDLLNPAVKDQVVFDTPDTNHDGDLKVIHLVNNHKAISLMEYQPITDLLPGKYTDQADRLTIQFDVNHVYPHNRWYKIQLSLCR